MKHWEVTYKMESKYYFDECVDYWMSTTPITEETIQRHWDKIHQDYFKITDVVCNEAEESGKFHIVKSITK